jgi:AMMECR1 domain-containing protein
VIAFSVQRAVSDRRFSPVTTSERLARLVAPPSRPVEPACGE